MNYQFWNLINYWFAWIVNFNFILVLNKSVRRGHVDTSGPLNLKSNQHNLLRVQSEISLLSNRKKRCFCIITLDLTGLKINELNLFLTQGWSPNVLLSDNHLFHRSTVVEVMKASYNKLLASKESLQCKRKIPGKKIKSITLWWIKW